LVTARIIISLRALAQQLNQMRITVQLLGWCYKSWSNMIFVMCVVNYYMNMFSNTARY